MSFSNFYIIFTPVFYRDKCNYFYHIKLNKN